MLIYPHGLLDGERLAECSDEAKLHFPRLVALANGFGRMKLSQKEILENAYGGFHAKPKRENLTAWVKEYSEQHLLLVYSAHDGTVWGQWCGVPDNALPRYKTSADNRSRAPPPEAVDAFDAAYALRKRERSKASGDALEIPETFGNVLKPSEDLETFPRVVVGGGGVEEKQVPPLPSTPNAQEQSTPQETPKSSETRRKGKNSSVSVKPYDPRYLAAYDRYPKRVDKDVSEAKWGEAVERLVAGERGKPPMSRENAYRFLEDAARDFATKMQGNEQKHIRSIHRWLNERTYLDYAPKPKVEWVIPDPAKL